MLYERREGKEERKERQGNSKWMRYALLDEEEVRLNEMRRLMGSVCHLFMYFIVVEFYSTLGCNLMPKGIKLRTYYYLLSKLRFT